MQFFKQQFDADLGGAEWHFAYSRDLSADVPVFHTIADIHASGLPHLSASVPGNVELDLMANGIILDPFVGMNMVTTRWVEDTHFWYFRTFPSPATPAGFDTILMFEGIDCFADIYLNGRLLGSTDNMLIPHSFCVDGLLQEGEGAANELIVHLAPAVAEVAKIEERPLGLTAQQNNHEGLYIRKAPHMFGWDIMPRAVSAGIWRPVTVCYRPAERFEDVYLQTASIGTEQRSARLICHYDTRLQKASRGSTRYRVVVKGVCGDSEFTGESLVVGTGGQFSIPVTAPKLWWSRNLGEPHLYEVTATLYTGDTPLDTVTFRHGIRTVRLERTGTTDAAGTGKFCFYINGEPVFALGTNWVPADAYHSRDAGRLPQLLALLQDSGSNMVRCWGGNVYEDDAFFDFCDEAGILVWQDFAMACATYPTTATFQEKLRAEARSVVRRLRQHPCLALWAGDNECDQAPSWYGQQTDPNTNVLTRSLLPLVLREEDPYRPYLPSSPYINAEAFAKGEAFLPENHLWGPRDYYKSDFYTKSLCHFASEIGYHGCPHPESIRGFLSPEKVWPYQNNAEWILHGTSAVPGVPVHDYRVELMVKQIRSLFGTVPDNLDDFALASQSVQAEAMKFFVELFRGAKWRRTGILWWNLVDGWPQFSDAVIDYYLREKLAFPVLQRAQAPIYLLLREPVEGEDGAISQDIIACNETRTEVSLGRYSVQDVDSGDILYQAKNTRLSKNANTLLGQIADTETQRFLKLDWESDQGAGISHYLAGKPPFSLEQYRQWLQTIQLPFSFRQEPPVH